MSARIHKEQECATPPAVTLKDIANACPTLRKRPKPTHVHSATGRAFRLGLRAGRKNGTQLQILVSLASLEWIKMKFGTLSHYPVYTNAKNFAPILQRASV